MRTLAAWSENTPLQNWLILSASVLLVLFAGLMSGLTLGLMSLDMTQMEVLKRSGTATERKHALKIMPVIKNSHFLLVTLLLCNAGAMEALPLFLDRLANPITAIILSATAVLFFGEIVPQSVCTRYGLVIGANLAWLVRLLMILTGPVAWPVGKLLDWLLGPEHHVLFRRQQLKALVDIHGEERGMGGKLSADETKVITGALDLTNKIAYRSMTPLDKVFMLSTDDVLNERMLRAIVESGHSRVPIHKAGDRTDLIGLILVKELLQYKMSRDVPVCLLKMRSLPRLSADTRMYDMLKLFQTGRTHMAVLTQPLPPAQAGDPSAHTDTTAAAASAAATGADGTAAAASSVAADKKTGELVTSGSAAAAGPSVSNGAAPPPASAVAGGGGGGVGGGAAAAAGVSGSGGAHVGASSVSAGADGQAGSGAGGMANGNVAGRAGPTDRQGIGSGSSYAGASEVQEQEPQETSRLMDGQPSSSSGGVARGQHPPPRSGTSKHTKHADKGRDSTSAAEEEQLEEDEDLDLDIDLEEEEEELKQKEEANEESKLSVVSMLQKKNKEKRSRAKELQARRLRRFKMVPQLAPPGQPIGIITIEDVIEELIRAEIVDETDRFVDNEHLVRVEQAMLSQNLPERLRQVVAGNVGAMLKASLMSSQQQQHQQHQHGGPSSATLPQHHRPSHPLGDSAEGASNAATAPLLGRRQ